MRDIWFQTNRNQQILHHFPTEITKTLFTQGEHKKHSQQNRTNRYVASISGRNPPFPLGIGIFLPIQAFIQLSFKQIETKLNASDFPILYKGNASQQHLQKAMARSAKHK